VLGTYVCEELNQQVVVLLSCAPLAVVGGGVFELDSFEGCFDLGGVGVLVEALCVVDVAS